MAAHTRVLNNTTGQRIKRSQAKGRIDQCLSVWVEEGYSIRDLSLAEIVKARAEKAREKERMEEPLPIAEIHGLKFVPPATTRYRAPHEAFERFVCGLDTPTPGMRCHWPPEAAKYAESCA